MTTRREFLQQTAALPLAALPLAREEGYQAYETPGVTRVPDDYSEDGTLKFYHRSDTRYFHAATLEHNGCIWQAEVCRLESRRPCITGIRGGVAFDEPTGAMPTITFHCRRLWRQLQACKAPAGIRMGSVIRQGQPEHATYGEIELLSLTLIAWHDWDIYMPEDKQRGDYYQEPTFMTHWIWRASGWFASLLPVESE